MGGNAGLAVAVIVRVMTLTTIGTRRPPGARNVRKASASEIRVLAAAPGRQARGLGGALLQPILDRCDRDGHGAYLEATTSRGRDLYLRYGFAMLEEVALPGGGPLLWRMWRGPAAA